MTFGEQDSKTNENGVVVTVGFQVEGQPAAIVLPMCEVTSVSTADRMCTDACNAVVNSTIFTTLLGKLSVNTYISHITADGMIDGRIPCRFDFASSLFPGTLSGDPVPQQVAALVTMWRTTRGAFGSKTCPRAHQYLPGTSVTLWPGLLLSSIHANDIEAIWATLCFTGCTDTVSGSTWARYLSVPYDVVAGRRVRTPGLVVREVGALDCRRYPATQRRRLLPHL